jgi:hypothetical protein
MFLALLAAVGASVAAIRAAGLADWVHPAVCDVTQGLPGRYDLITMFDVVHDMAFPAGGYLPGYTHGSFREPGEVQCHGD